MAEERLSLPGSPSPDVSKYWRRISTGRLNLLYAEERVLPNYLRASTGSCHDLCKFGKRQESEENSRASPLKRVATKLPHDKILTQSLDSPLRKRTISKTSTFKLPSSSGRFDSNGSHVKREVAKNPGRAGHVRKVETSAKKSSEGLSSKKNKNFPEKIKKQPETFSESRLANSIVRKSKFSPASKTVGASPVEASLKSKEATEPNKHIIVLKPKSAKEKSLAVLRSRQENDSATRKKIDVSKPKVAADSKRIVVPVRASLSQKRLLEKSQNLKAKKCSSLNVFPALKNQQEVRTPKAEKFENESKWKEEHKDSSEEKTLYVIKTETENETVESAQNERCVVDPPTIDSSLSPPSNGEKNKEEPDCVATEAEDNGPTTKAQEKSEGMMTEAEDRSSEKLEKSDFTTNEEEEEEEEDDDDDESVSADVDTPRQRKNRTLSSEDTGEDKTMKLNFRRGRIVDVRSLDNSPRRLTFKRGRVLVAGGDTTPRSVGRRSFKKKGTNFNAEEHKPRSVKVVLRHQDAQEKKDSRGLFNNVIEETANKLVETRKSKVKALVGAFERVISLQERSSSSADDE